ncbi:MAG TPA: GAF and ANTAR domain-containing protein [Microthrixaceae bacterium]|nr:GAF and ANTAR domain-containing protein [Microthrixaceae bacterium]
MEVALREVIDALVELFEVDGAGLMLLDAEDALRYVVATDERTRVLESAQEELGYGPCVDSLVTGRAFETSDIAVDDRWPGVSELVAAVDVHAVLGVPVMLGGAPVGSLNVLRVTPYDWDDSDRRAILAFCRTIEVLIAQAVLAHRRGKIVDQLEYALEHRVMIERAIGVVMGRNDLDPVQAFNRVRRTARSGRRRVADVADDIVSGRLAV